MCHLSILLHWCCHHHLPKCQSKLTHKIHRKRCMMLFLTYFLCGGEEGMVVYCNWLTSQGFWYKKPWSTTGILGDRSKASSKNNSLLALQKSWPGHPCFGRNLWKNVYHQPGSAFEIERKQTSLSFLKKTCDTEVLLFQTCPSFIFEKKTCLPFWERKKLHKCSFKGKTCLPNV